MFEITPIGWVRGGRVDAADDDWAAVLAEIELDSSAFGAKALEGLGEFSHLDVVYVFHEVPSDAVETRARRPRGNPDWSEVGIFAQRARMRPNRLGVTTCEIVSVTSSSVRVRGLDAIDGTPVVDLKPYMTGFAPRTEVRQPQWAIDLMANYWVDDSS
ncbi:MAG: TrmO family methyltransferase [Acidimicrobiales bacterium]